MFFSSNGYQPCPTHSEGLKRGMIRDLEICSGHCCDSTREGCPWVLCYIPGGLSTLWARDVKEKAQGGKGTGWGVFSKIALAIWIECSFFFFFYILKTNFTEAKFTSF